MGTLLAISVPPCAVCAQIGVLDIKVKIMLSWDPSDKIGPKSLSDHMNIVDLKDEILSTVSISAHKVREPELPAML